MMLVSDLILRFFVFLTSFSSFLLLLEKLSTRRDCGIKPGPTQNSDSNISDTMHPISCRFGSLSLLSNGFNL
jgi:hypothetical protein